MSSILFRFVFYFFLIHLQSAPHDLNGKNPKPELRPISTGHSYGCRSGSIPCRHDAWKQAVKALKASGQFVVASAGNAGSRCKTVRGPPGKLDSVSIRQ
jgi:hypothetical protein